MIKVHRNNLGQRDYLESDIEWIKFIKKLKDTGMILRDIQLYSKLRYEGDSTIEERKKILENHKLFVQEQCEMWNEYLHNLDDKIEIYKEKLSNKK